MKKKNIILALCGAGCLQCHAQTIPVMTEQLAALRTLQQSVGKGYTIATHGLQTIGNEQDGEYQQHCTWILSLSAVNPTLFNYSTDQKTIVYDKTYRPSIPQPADKRRQVPVGD
jgi:hypothetical protein